MLEISELFQEIDTQDLPLLGREKFANSAVIIPLVTFNEQIHILFEKRSETIPQGGEICFPGGMYEPKDDGDPVEAALRECSEEIGIGRESVSVMGTLGTMVSVSGKAIDVIVGELNILSLDELDINYDEVVKVFTVPLDYFIITKPKSVTISVGIKFEDGKVTNTYGKYSDESRHELKSPYYEYSGELIWGITGEIVSNFAELISRTASYRF